jgi:hypothetical protein
MTLARNGGQSVPTARRQSSPKGPCDTTYLEFSETRPPLFIKAEEPLEAEEWVRVMEEKFGLIRCTETQSTVCRTIAKRACQHLVGKFFRSPTCWASDYLGGIHASVPRALCSRGSAPYETRRVYSVKARRRYCNVVSQ